MRFLMMHRVSEQEEKAWDPTPEFIEKMGAYMEKAFADGTVITAEGVWKSDRGAMIRKDRGGHVKSTDGPFTEAKEVIGGFALINAEDRAEAVALAREYIALFDGIEISVEVREVVEAEDLPQH
ncbi:YciI family protein [Lentzea guizhouensis]|nr:YciI family protein [Lentzea guizhouensis]